MKSELLCYFRVLPRRICATCRRVPESESRFVGKAPRARIFRAACEATSRDSAHPEAFAANYFARTGERAGRGRGVIEEDSIFPCRHRGFVSPWLRLQSCGLLSSFFMFSLFDVVSLGGLLIQSSSSALARAILFAARIILQIFPLFRRRAVRAFRLPSLPPSLA